MFDNQPRNERHSGDRYNRHPEPVWVDLAQVVDDARQPPERYNPRGLDLSQVVPGRLLARIPTAHGRSVGLIVCSIHPADGGPGTRFTLLVPWRAVSPRVDERDRRGTEIDAAGRARNRHRDQRSDA